MSERIYAAVDLGAESGRVLSGHFDGARLRLEEAHRFPNGPVRANNTLCWDALHLWSDIQTGLRSAAQGGEVAGIGVDTWGVDFGLLDERGDLLGNPVHYRDARTNGMIERAFEIVPRDQFFAQTGLQFMFFNSVYQLMALATRQSSSLSAARRLLFMPDLLNFWLCGAASNEYTIASTSALLNPSTRDWNHDLMKQLGIPTRVFGEIIAPATKLGTLRSEVAADCGLPAGTPVYTVGSHDTASAVAAVPAQGSDWAFLSSGTWSLMGLELPEPLINERVAHLNFTNEGGVNGTVRFLKNIAGLWLVQECRRSFARDGQSFDYAQLTQLASDAPAFASLIEPDDARFAAPPDMPRAIADFCRASGQAAPATPGAFVRCALESLALKYRRVFEWLQEIRGRDIATLHIVGGGTQNRLLSQWTADCLGVPVVSGPVEATAIGNALTQAMARGDIADLKQLRDIVRASFSIETFDPDTSARARWDEAYARFETFAV